MKVEIKTLKFPYMFWFFNRSYLCEVDFKAKTYSNIECDTKYTIRPLNSYAFLALKYLPLLFVFYFGFSADDFSFNKRIVISYVLAFCLLLNINFLENLARKIGIFAVLCVSIFAGFTLDSVFLICALSLKYFILLSTFLLAFIDSKCACFELMKDNKVVSHFLVNKNLVREQ